MQQSWVKTCFNFAVCLANSISPLKLPTCISSVRVNTQVLHKHHPLLVMGNKHIKLQNIAYLFVCLFGASIKILISSTRDAGFSPCRKEEKTSCTSSNCRLGVLPLVAIVTTSPCDTLSVHGSARWKWPRPPPGNILVPNEFPYSGTSWQKLIFFVPRWVLSCDRSAG